MKLVSTTAPHPRRIAVQDVVEVTLDGRDFLVATAHGRLMGADVHLEGHAAALEQLSLLARLADPRLRLVHAEIDSVELAAEQMAQVFEVMPEGGAVMFLCRTPEVREAAEELLDIHLAVETLTRH